MSFLNFQLNMKYLQEKKTSMMVPTYSQHKQTLVYASATYTCTIGNIVNLLISSMRNSEGYVDFTMEWEHFT